MLSFRVRLRIREGNGWFKAFDAKTGKVPWRFQCGAGVNAPPVSYTVNGKQYIAVAAGGNSQMNLSPMAAKLSKEDMQDLASYFADQKAAAIAFKPDPARVKLGFAKTEEVICTMRHLGGFKGQNEIPRLANQHYDYPFKQLTDFKARNRTNEAGNMTSVAKTLSDEDIINLSHYIATLN